MKNKFTLMIPPVFAILLELLPYGAVLHFAVDGGTIRQTFSYFSLIPFGYASFAPLITALLTCSVLVLLFIYFFKTNPKIYSACKFVSISAFFASLAPLLYGMRYFSFVGILISVVLLMNTLMLFIYKRKSAN